MVKPLGLLLCVLAACGGSTGAKGPTAAAVEPAKSLRPSKSGVLFVVAYEALLPVGCYNAQLKKWDSGEKCFDILPDDASVQLESGRLVKVSGWRIPTPTDCTLSTPLIMFEEAEKEKPGSFAIWPPSDRVQRVSWDATKGVANIPESDRARLGKTLVASEVHVVQMASADLDGDGTSEILYSVNALGFDPANRKGISGLYLADHRNPEIVPIRSSDHAVFRVEAAVDIDDDGLKEVWLSERTFHPNGLRTDTMVLAFHAPGGLTPLTPQESCWPPAKIK
jgi:hypothetical protein